MMGDCCCSKAKVTETTWKGEPAVRFSAGGFEALLVPGVGANLIELKNIEEELDILRSPENIELDAFKARPQVYGIPVLFPPNRIEDGRFSVAGREYILPIIDVNGNNFIHGFLRTRGWKVGTMETENDTARVEVVFNADKNTDFFEQFPHEFEFKILYTLSCHGLDQEVTIINKGESPMPMGLGFHTAFNAPFHKQGKADDCRLKVSIGEKWELTNRTLPTGKLLPLGEPENLLPGDGMKPQGFKFEGHFTAKPFNKGGKDFNGAVIEDKTVGLRLVYEAGKGYGHWVIWNETGDKGFICPEPQTWVINAPNVKLPDEVTGFKLLSAGESWSEICKIYVEKI